MFWYFYRPQQLGCELETEDVIEFAAQLRPNGEATEGMYPEYDKVWEDDALNVVAIFGKAKEDSEGYDAGINAFWTFADQVERELGSSVTNVEAFGGRIPRPVLRHVARWSRGEGQPFMIEVYLMPEMTSGPNMNLSHRRPITSSTMATRVWGVM